MERISNSSVFSDEALLLSSQAIMIITMMTAGTVLWDTGYWIQTAE